MHFQIVFITQIKRLVKYFSHFRVISVHQTKKRHKFEEKKIQTIQIRIIDERGIYHKEILYRVEKLNPV